MEDNKELTIKEETRAVAPVSEKTITDYLAAFGLMKKMDKQLQLQCIEMAKAYNLNPFKKEVHFVPYKGEDGDQAVAIIVGYETYLKRAEAHPMFDGYEVKINGKFKHTKITKRSRSGDYQVDAIVPDGDVSCTCTVYRKDRRVPTCQEVWFDEYDRHNRQWQTMPRTMIEKVATAQALRKAFPTELGGMPYTKEEQWEPEVIQTELRDVTPETNGSEFPNSSPEPVPESAAAAPQKVKATPEQIDEMAKLAEDFTEQELADFRAKYIGYPDKMITAMREARIRKFEAGTLRQDEPEQKKYPWATPEQSAELERLEKEGQEQKKETVGEPAAPLFPDDSKELYK